VVVPDVLDRAGFIRLGSQAGNTVLNGTVNGDAGSQVRFYYQPDSPTGSATDNRFRRIRVTYEDGSLEHIVYNRQGYGDVQMTAGGAWWSSFNALRNTNPSGTGNFAFNPWSTFLSTYLTYSGWFFKWGNNGGMHPTVPVPGDVNTQNLELTITSNANPKSNHLTGWANITKNVYNRNVTTNRREPCPEGYMVAASAQYTTLASGSMASGYVYDDAGYEMGALIVNGSTNLFFPMGSCGYGIRNGANNGAIEYAVSGTPSTWYWARGADCSTAVAHTEFAFEGTTMGVLAIPNIITAGKTQDSGKFVRCVRQ